MYTDIVFPSGNENEFAEMAERLGFGAIVFAYEKPEAMPEQKPLKGLKIFYAAVSGEKELQRPKKKAELVLFRSTGNDRWILEKSNADIIFEMESSQKKDFMHHRASGLNQVMCKIAQETGKTIAFSFSSLLSANPMLRAQLIGKMMQNARFCRKYKVKTIIASFAKTPYQMRAPSELAAFGASIGMHPKEAAESLCWKK